MKFNRAVLLALPKDFSITCTLLAPGGGVTYQIRVSDLCLIKDIGIDDSLD